jgi:hypothetical protein
MDSPFIVNESLITLILAHQKPFINGRVHTIKCRLNVQKLRLIRANTKFLYIKAALDPTRHASLTKSQEKTQPKSLVGLRRHFAAQSAFKCKRSVKDRVLILQIN